MFLRPAIKITLIMAETPIFVSLRYYLSLIVAYVAIFSS